MFVPDGFKTGPDGFDLTVFLHGAPGTVERNLVRARRPGVLVTVVLPGLSETYARKFREP